MGLANVNTKRLVAVFFLLFALAFMYHYEYINEFPSYIHAWAQSDRYALSLGFLDNGLNFFKPQTFTYNHQFPDKWMVPSESTITAVDFPIHDYIPALLMKVLGTTSPWVFRSYILLYSLLGLFFLYKLSFAITKDYVKSIFVIVFAATSPVYVYYQGSFLPSVPSLSNAIIGIYFYYRFLMENRNKQFGLSILFLTLGALSRTTFAIPLIAVLGIEVIRLLKKQTKLIPKLVPVGLSILALVSYLLYNGYLREVYGSIFLNYILPPESIAQAKEILISVYYSWFFQYFTRPHYLIFLGVSLLAAYFILSQKTSLNKANKYFSLLTITYLAGCTIFAFLMLRQFPAHDYYFLDTFFLPLLMALVFLLSLLPVFEKRYLKSISVAAVALASFILILQPINSQQERRETGLWDRTAVTINNYKNSSAFLDSLGIAKDAKMLVIDAVAPNIPFILMDRKGFAIIDTRKENVETALTWDYDYVVVQNEYFIPEVYSLYPGVLSKLNKVADNGKISICERASNNRQSLLDFMGLNEKKPQFEKSVNFENVPDSLWQNLNPSDKYAFSDSLSGHLTPSITYGLTYKTKDLPELKTNSRTLYFSSYFLRESPVDCELVVSIHADGQNIYYKSHDLEYLLKQKGAWEKVSLLFQLPEVQSDDYEFAIFLWNTGNSELYYDDFEFSIY